MSDFMRKEVIRHLEFLKLAGQINAKPEKINPDYLQFAIDSLKTDETYQIEYENRDFIEIPEGATNGDMIKALFPNISVYEHGATYSINNEYNFNSTWWNSPYKKGGAE